MGSIPCKPVLEKTWAVPTRQRRYKARWHFKGSRARSARVCEEHGGTTVQPNECAKASCERSPVSGFCQSCKALTYEGNGLRSLLHWTVIAFEKQTNCGPQLTHTRGAPQTPHRSRPRCERTLLEPLPLGKGGSRSPAAGTIQSRSRAQGRGGETARGETALQGSSERKMREHIHASSWDSTNTIVQLEGDNAGWVGYIPGWNAARDDVAQAAGGR